MAAGGAWQSDVFDNGSDFHKGPAPKSPVPGVPAAMYNPPASMAAATDGSHLPVLSIVLRAACVVFSAVGFALIASNTGSYVVAGGAYYDYNYFQYTWKAINSSNLAYLLAIDVIVCVYSIVQLILSIVSSCSGKPVLASPTKPASTINFVFDQALTYMLMAGCGAGAAVAASFQKGESGSHSCGGGFQVFCDKNAAAVAMSFVAFLCLALSCCMAYFRVYKMARV